MDINQFRHYVPNNVGYIMLKIPANRWEEVRRLTAWYGFDITDVVDKFQQSENQSYYTPNTLWCKEILDEMALEPDNDNGIWNQLESLIEDHLKDLIIGVGTRCFDQKGQFLFETEKLTRYPELSLYILNNEA